MYEKKNKSWLKHLDFMILDILCLQLSFILAYQIRFGIGNPYKNKEYLNLAIVYLLIDFCVAVLFGSFKNVLKRGWYKEFTCVLRHVFLVEGMALFYLFSTQKGDIYSRISFYMMVLLYLCITYLARSLWKRKLRKRGLRGARRSLVVIAPEAKLAECIENICHTSCNTCSFVGAVASDAPLKGETIREIPVVADLEDVIGYICREWVDEVFLWGLEEDCLSGLTSQLDRMGVVTHVGIARAGGIGERKQQIERLGNYTVLTTSLNYATPTQLSLKRLMDIAGGLAGCLVTLLLAVLIGPAIYIASPGPIFFTQERVGRNGRRFKIHKFRTMYLDAEERKKELQEQNRIGDGRMFKLDYDPRIIGNRRREDGSIREGLGSFLRRTSLDEFPQMLNILMGEMSLVGTRPPTVDEWERYEPHHRARLSFRPGLTGLWQVSGRSNITDFEEVVKLDLKYIDEWSIGLDVKILLKTIGVVLDSDGAM